MKVVVVLGLGRVRCHLQQEGELVARLESGTSKDTPRTPQQGSCRRKGPVRYSGRDGPPERNCKSLNLAQLIRSLRALSSFEKDSHLSGTRPCCATKAISSDQVAMRGTKDGNQDKRKEDKRKEDKR